MNCARVFLLQKRAKEIQESFILDTVVDAIEGKTRLAD
jgi:hypothetical protein